MIKMLEKSKYRLIVPPSLTLALTVLATTHIFYQVINFSPNTNQILLTASGCFIIYYRSQRSNILKLLSDKEFGLFVPLACISLGLKFSSIYFIAYSGLINELGNGLAIAALFALFLKNILFLKIFSIMLVLLFFVPNIPYFEAYLSFPVRLVTSEIAEMIFVTFGQDISRSGTVIRLGELKVAITDACDGLTLLQSVLWLAWPVIAVQSQNLRQTVEWMLYFFFIVFAANLLRILILIVGAKTVSVQILATDFHIYTGYATSALAIFLFASSIGLGRRLSY